MTHTCFQQLVDRQVNYCRVRANHLCQHHHSSALVTACLRDHRLIESGPLDAWCWCLVSTRPTAVNQLSMAILWEFHDSWLEPMSEPKRNSPCRRSCNHFFSPLFKIFFFYWETSWRFYFRSGRIWRAERERCALGTIWQKLYWRLVIVVDWFASYFRSFFPHFLILEFRQPCAFQLVPRSFVACYSQCICQRHADQDGRGGFAGSAHVRLYSATHSARLDL